ncbi:MAG: peptide ABC transporter substrate-binding protein [Eubacteriales bacterium]
MRYIKSFIPLMNKSKRVIMILIALSFSCLFFSGCAAMESILNTENTYVLDANDISDQEKTITPLSGGEITIAMPTNLKTFNPLTENNINMINLYTLIFESPLSLDIDGQFRGDLIENWTVDTSGQVWTFYLRKNIQWHNGFGELTADDLVFTLDIITDMDTEDSIYARYNKRIGEYYALDKYTLVLNAVDPRTIYDDEIEPEKSSYIEYAMTFPVLCKSYYENYETFDNLWPIGSGPYEFTDFDINEGIRLSVNDDWWKKQPYITTIRAIPMADAKGEIEAYANQVLDVIGTSEISANRYQKYGVTNVEEYMTQYYDCLVPNLYVSSTGETDEMFIHDVRARQAIAYALNKSQIISKVLVNHAVATDVPIPPDSWLYDKTLSIYEYNEKRALALLYDMGYTERDENGFLAKMNEETGELITCSFELMYPKELQDNYKTNIASLIEEQLEDIGIRVDLRELSSTLFTTKVEAGSYDVALMSFYLARNPDVRFMLHSSRSTANYGYYKDEDMDAALLACGAAVTDDEKKLAYSEMQKIFVEQLPQIPLYFMTNSLIYDDSIQGVSEFRDLNIYNDIQNWYVLSEVQ